MAEAAAQAPVDFSAPGAGCCGAAQQSELLETECVLAPGATPHGSAEEAGLAPVGRWGRCSEMPSESSGQLGEKSKDTVGHVSHTRICAPWQERQTPKGC